MANTRRYKAAKDKRERGGFVALPHVVLRSVTYAKLSPRAVKLLMDMLSQYKGDNNGDLCIAWKLMKERAWRSQTTLNKAKKELLEREWIEVTRYGGMNRPTLYAITFLAVDDCKGKIDIPATHSPKSLWRRHEPVPPLKIKKPTPETGVTKT